MVEGWSYSSSSDAVAQQAKVVLAHGFDWAQHQLLGLDVKSGPVDAVHLANLFCAGPAANATLVPHLTIAPIINGNW